MSKKLFYLLGIAATIILGTILYLNFCCTCCLPTTPDSNTGTAVIERNKNPFVLTGPGMNYQCNDNFNFLQNNSTVATPVSDSIKLGLENLKTLLISNPEQIISITGYAMSSEKNNSKFENLGLARANDVKEFLESQGLPKAQLLTKGEIISDWEIKNDTLLGPVKFEFNELVAKNTDDTSLLKDQINANPLILYFDANKSTYNLSPDEDQKIKDIAKYTSEIPNAAVLIVGHSDNTGNRDANIILAKKRAEFAKKYLVKNGIESSHIETQSKGPDEPVAGNETAEGKAKNRRTVVTIK